MPETQQNADERALALMDEAMQRREERLTENFENQLRELAQPREERRLPVTPEDEGEQGNEVDPTAMRRPAGEVETRLATHPLYRMFDGTLEAPWRIPEGDHYIQMWAKGLCYKDARMLREADDNLERIFKRQWLIGDQSGAGYGGTAGPVVPIPLLNIVMINRDRVAKIPPLSTAVQLTSSYHRLPQMGQATVGMVAENATKTREEPPLTEKSMTARKMQGHAQVSDEALNDSAFNLTSLLGQRMGQAMGQFEDVQACQSNGTAPNITENIKTGLTPTNIAGALSYDNVVALYFGVGQPYRMNGVWYANDKGAEALTKVRDSANYPIFSQQNARPGAIVDDSADGFVFRRPVYEVPLVSAVTTNGEGSILFMDPSVYGWGRRQGMTARASDIPGWDNDRWAFKFTQRVDGTVIDAGGSGNASRSLAENLS